MDDDLKGISEEELVLIFRLSSTLGNVGLMKYVLEAVQKTDPDIKDEVERNAKLFAAHTAGIVEAIAALSTTVTIDKSAGADYGSVEAVVLLFSRELPQLVYAVAAFNSSLLNLREVSVLTSMVTRVRNRAIDRIRWQSSKARFAVG